jgi:hypothetical protein
LVGRHKLKDHPHEVWAATLKPLQPIVPLNPIPLQHFACRLLCDFANRKPRHRARTASDHQLPQNSNIAQLQTALTMRSSSDAATRLTRPSTCK